MDPLKRFDFWVREKLEKEGETDNVYKRLGRNSSEINFPKQTATPWNFFWVFVKKKRKDKRRKKSWGANKCLQLWMILMKKLLIIKSTR